MSETFDLAGRILRHSPLTASRISAAMRSAEERAATALETDLAGLMELAGRALAEEVMQRTGVHVTYLIGTMIELPRAARWLLAVR